MKPQASTLLYDFHDPLTTTEGVEEAHDEDLWFPPEPLKDELDDPPPVPGAEPSETEVQGD